MTRHIHPNAPDRIDLGACKNETLQRTPTVQSQRNPQCLVTLLLEQANAVQYACRSLVAGTKESPSKEILEAAPRFVSFDVCFDQEQAQTS